MKQKKYTVLAHFKAKKGMDEELKEALKKLIQPTLAEDGCLNYELHQSIDNKDEFMFYENWASKEAHAKHNLTPHIKAWRNIKDKLLAKNCIVTAWKMLF